MAQTLAQIKALLEARDLAPRKRFGQNFLIDANLVRKLVDAAAPAPGELVLEIGPGTGTLTEELLSTGARVLACELDRGLATLLREQFNEHEDEQIHAHSTDRFTLIEGDCMANKHALAPAVVDAINDQPFVLVANLPYNIATPLMLTLLTQYPACRGMFVTIQREVGQRLAAAPGSRTYGSIRVVFDALAQVKTIATLPASCFWPRPDVTSIMLGIERSSAPRIEAACAVQFAAFCQFLFSSRRKQLQSVLKNSRKQNPAASRTAPAPSRIDLPAGIDPTMRAEQLDTSQCIALFEIFG